MASEAPSERNCAGCKHPLKFVGIRDLRTGGYGGLGTAVLGAVAGLSEDTLTVALYGCSACGRLEMFLPPAQR